MRKTAAEIAEMSAKNKVAWYKPGKGFGEVIKDAPKTRQKAHRAMPTPADSITLTLPYPPSVNHYWRRNKGAGMHISKEGKEFQTAVLGLCGNLKGIKGRVVVVVEASPPDCRKRDLDNIFKALCDALAHAGIIEDDCKIDGLAIVRCDPVKGGSVTVTVMQL